MDRNRRIVPSLSVPFCISFAISFSVAMSLCSLAGLLLMLFLPLPVQVLVNLLSALSQLSEAKAQTCLVGFCNTK